MILDLMLFTLGLLVAGLASLALLPVVWRRALRLSGERLARLVPLTAEEIAADRDHLRADHAVDLRRTEQRLERAEADRAALRAEAGRRETRILALDHEGARAQVSIASLEADLAALRREATGLRAEAGAREIALGGAIDLAERRLGEVAALRAERDGIARERQRLDDERQGLHEQVDRLRGSVAGLETRLMGADILTQDLARERERARQMAATHAETLAAIAAERDAALESRDRVTASEAPRAMRPSEVTRIPRPEASDAEVHPLDATIKPSLDGLSRARTPARLDDADPAVPDRAAPAEETPGTPAAGDAGDIEALRTELAFMIEQAASAERRAAAARRAHDDLMARQSGLEEPQRDPAELRAAIGHLADDIIEAVRRPAG